MVKTIYAAAFAMVAGFQLALAVQGLHAKAGLPAYTIAEVEVTSFGDVRNRYRTITVPPTDRRFHRPWRPDGSVVDGAPPKRIAVIQWESLEKAKAFYEF